MSLAVPALAVGQWLESDPPEQFTPAVPLLVMWLLLILTVPAVAMTPLPGLPWMKQFSTLADELAFSTLRFADVLKLMLELRICVTETCPPRTPTPPLRSTLV